VGGNPYWQPTLTRRAQTASHVSSEGSGARWHILLPVGRRKASFLREGAKIALVCAFLLFIQSSTSAATAKIAFSTYFGGSGDDSISAMVIDRDGYVYVIGWTNSTDFPTTPGAYQTTSNAGANCGTPTSFFPCQVGFLAKLNPTGTALVYSTFLPSLPQALAVDTASNAYVTGGGIDGPFPVTAGALNNPQARMYVMKVNPSGSDLVYSARFGSSTALDFASAIAVDASGNAYVTGWSFGTDFPVTPSAFQTPETGAFIAKLNDTASALVYSARLGGSDSANTGNVGTHPLSIAVSINGEAHVAGVTDSAQFPTTPNAFRQSRAGGSDAFITKLDSSGSSLLYSSFLGGSSGGGDSTEGANRIALDSFGNAYISGAAVLGTSTDVQFPRTAGVFQRVFDLGPLSPRSNGFIAKFNTTLSGSQSLLYSTLLGRGGAADLIADAAGNVYLAGATGSNVFPTTSNALNACKLTTQQPSDVLLSVLNPTASRLLFSTLINATLFDAASGVGLDGNQNPYIAGTTQSAVFPTTAGVLRQTNTGPSGSSDGFITKFDSSVVAPQPPALVICQPAPASGLENNFPLAASLQDSKRASSMSVFLDGQKVFGQSGLNVIDTTITASAGTHRLTVQGRTASGVLVSKSIQIGVATNFRPTVASITPNSASPGGPSFSLKVLGLNYVPTSVVRWNGSNRATTFVNDQNLTATIPASDIAAVGTAKVTVFTPTPGGGTSPSQLFTIGTGGGCTPTIDPSVAICAPVDGTTVHSPVTIQATTKDSHSVSLMQIYVDGVKKYQVAGSSLNTSLAMAIGPHRITAQAKDVIGRTFKATVNVTVK